MFLIINFYIKNTHQIFDFIQKFWQVPIFNPSNALFNTFFGVYIL